MTKQERDAFEAIKNQNAVLTSDNETLKSQLVQERFKNDKLKSQVIELKKGSPEDKEAMKAIEARVSQRMASIEKGSAEWWECCQDKYRIEIALKKMGIVKMS